MDVLRTLAQTPGVTPETIAKATALPPGGVNWNLDELEGRGLVEHELVRVAGEINGLYRLTPRGLDALRRISP